MRESQPRSQSTVCEAGKNRQRRGKAKVHLERLGYRDEYWKELNRRNTIMWKKPLAPEDSISMPGTMCLNRRHLALGRAGCATRSLLVNRHAPHDALRDKARRR
jgi:hypothetical protein